MTPQVNIEEDFPKGHPARHDFDPDSPEAREWIRQNIAPMGERAFPVDHPAAADTPGNLNHVVFEAGVDPFNPQREAFTGRSPKQAEGVRMLSELATQHAKESPVLKPLNIFDVADALDAKRKQVRRDILTPAEYGEVIAKFQGA